MNRFEDPKAPAIEVQAITCPLCDSDQFSLVHKVRDYMYELPGSYQVVRCRKCAHIYMNPRPNDQSIMLCYPDEYAPYHATEQKETQTASAQASSGADRVSLPRRILRSIPGLRRFLFWLGLEYATHLPEPKTESARLLEVGCADGWFLKSAAAIGWKVDGVEPNQQAAARCRERGLSVRCGLFGDFQFDDSSREAVIFWMVLEHVAHPKQMLSEVHRILSPGGVLAFSIPNGGGFERVAFQKYWLGYDAPRHLQVFTAHKIKSLLHELGYERIKVIHQANVRFWWGSVATWGMDNCPRSKWPRRWMSYFLGEPPALWRWLFLIPGKLVSMLRCSGRITVIAYKPDAPQAEKVSRVD